MSFYNTTHETGETLKESHRMAKTQEGRILNYFLTLGTPLSPSRVLDGMNLNCPLTSIRRAITNLTLARKLIKTDEYSVGMYGKREHLWRLRTEEDRTNPEQFTLFEGGRE